MAGVARQEGIQQQVEAAAQRMETHTQGQGNGAVTVPDMVMNMTGVSEDIDDEVFFEMNHPGRAPNITDVP